MTRQFPRLAEAHYLLGEAYMAQGKPEPANGALQAALDITPKNALVQFRLAQAMTRGEQPKEALELLQRVAKQAPDMPNLHLELASTLLRLGRVTEALRESQAALTANPTDVRSYDLMGLAYAALEQYDKALDTLSRGLAVDTGSLATRLNKARVLDLQGNAEAAEQEYRAAMRANHHLENEGVAIAPVKVSVLGSFQVMLDEQPVIHFDSNKVRALLSYLAVESNRPHSREFLADLLWPYSTHTSALGNLRYTMSCLRKTIRDRQLTARDPASLDSQVANDSLSIWRDRLQFNSNACTWVDLIEFNRLLQANYPAILSIDSLARAASLYRGSFLEGFFLPDNAAFDEWILLKREHYNRLI